MHPLLLEVHYIGLTTIVLTCLVFAAGATSIVISTASSMKMIYRENLLSGVRGMSFRRSLAHHTSQGSTSLVSSEKKDIDAHSTNDSTTQQKMVYLENKLHEIMDG